MNFARRPFFMGGLVDDRKSLYVPNSFQVPNAYVDRLFRYLSGSEITVLLVLLRKTYGWQKISDRVSLSQFTELGGVCRAAASKAVDRLVSCGLVVRESEPGEIPKFFLPTDHDWDAIERHLGVSENEHPVQKIDPPPVQKIDHPRLKNRPTKEHSFKPIKPPCAPKAALGDETVPLHTRLRTLIAFCYRFKFGTEPTWDGREGKALKLAIEANPQWTLENWASAVRNRFVSDDRPASERPAAWLPHVAAYLLFPLDRYRRRGSEGMIAAADEVADAYVEWLQEPVGAELDESQTPGDGPLLALGGENGAQVGVGYHPARERGSQGNGERNPGGEA